MDQNFRVFATSHKLSASIVLFVMLSCFGASRSAKAAEKVFDFYGIDLKLGALEQPVLGQLKKLGLVANSVGDENESVYLIVRPRVEGEASAHILGSLNFAKGKLIRAAKQWFNGPGSSYDFSMALHKAFASASQGSVTPCVVAQDRSSTPEFESVKTSFVCSFTTVEISTVSGTSESLKNVQIDEVLRGT